MSSMWVLVADDNEAVRLMLTNELREHFNLFPPVANGRQLMDAAMNRAPDVIVSDVGMPVMNGLEAMQALRRLGRAIPFVMVSADCDLGPVCLAAGAAAFVCKDDIRAQLAAAIRSAAAAGTGIRAGDTSQGRGPSRDTVQTAADVKHAETSRDTDR